MAKKTRGYWLYDLISLGDEPEPANAPHLRKLPSSGAPAYWRSIAQANRELDRWLESNGTYVSQMQVRSFTLPAPSVSLKR